MVWKHDRFPLDAIDPVTLRGWATQQLNERHLAQSLLGHLCDINGNASSDSIHLAH